MINVELIINMNKRKAIFFWVNMLLVINGFSQRKPNVVIIISDDHAYQTISAYGSKLMNTPSIDRIANEGVLFKKAYVTNSICGPSRAVLLTGKYSHKNGFKDNVSASFDGSQNTFIKELTRSGYQTAWIGKWHLESKPQGFSSWQVLPGQGSYYNPDFLMMDGSRKRYSGYVANVVEDIAEQWLDNRDTSKPFCIVIGHKNTHRTWIPDTADMGIFDDVIFPLPQNFYDDFTGRAAAAVQDMNIENTMRMGYDLKMFDGEIKDDNITRMNNAQRSQFDKYYQPIYEDLKKRNLSGKALVEWKYQRYLKDYLATAVSLDRNIGRTLDYLDRNRLTENTIVIYLSDQGFYMGEHGWFDKRFMYEESFRTPMVMRYPGHVKPASTSNQLVLNLDIAPTILEAAGVTVPTDMQGTSIWPLLKQGNKEGRKALYYHYYENGEHSVSPHFGISTGTFKLIRFYKRVNSWELYDLKNDPSEMKNLYNNPKYKNKIVSLKKTLLKNMERYEDTDAQKIFNEKVK